VFLPIETLTNMDHFLQSPQFLIKVVYSLLLAVEMCVRVQKESLNVTLRDVLHGWEIFICHIKGKT